MANTLLVRVLIRASLLEHQGLEDPREQVRKLVALEQIGRLDLDGVEAQFHRAHCHKGGAAHTLRGIFPIREATGEFLVMVIYDLGK